MAFREQAVPEAGLVRVAVLGRSAFRNRLRRLAGGGQTFRGIRGLIPLGHLLRASRARLPILGEAGRDHGDLHLLVHRLVDHQAGDDVRVRIHRLRDHSGGLGHLVQGQRLAARDVDQAAPGSLDRSVLEQGRRHGSLSRLESPVVSRRLTRAHHRDPLAAHDGPHVREVGVHLAGHRDQVADSLNRLAQNVVGGEERLRERCAAIDEAEQPLVRNRDDRVDRLVQLFETTLRDQHPPPALERERLGDHGHGQGPDLSRQGTDDRYRARSGAAAEASRQEDHVGAVQHVQDLVRVLQRRVASDVRIGARTQATGDLLPKLELRLRLASPQRLQVGVGRDELDAAQLAGDHPVDGIAAATADTDDLDLGRTEVLLGDSRLVEGRLHRGRLLLFHQNHGTLPFEPSGSVTQDQRRSLNIWRRLPITPRTPRTEPWRTSGKRACSSAIA